MNRLSVNFTGLAVGFVIAISAIGLGSLVRAATTVEDPFAGQSVGLSDPPTHAALVTPDDATDLTVPARCLWIGGDGNVKVTTYAGETLVFTAAKAGTQISGRFKRVWNTSTTATYIIAQW